MGIYKGIQNINIFMVFIFRNIISYSCVSQNYASLVQMRFINEVTWIFSELIESYVTNSIAGFLKKRYLFVRNKKKGQNK